MSDKPGVKSSGNRLLKPVMRCKRLVLLLPLLMVVKVEAHDPGLSAADVRIEASKVVANLTLARADVETIVGIDSDRDGEITPVEFDAARPGLEALAASALELRIDGRLA